MIKASTEEYGGTTDQDEGQETEANCSIDSLLETICENPKD